MENHKLYRLNDVLEITGLGKSTVYKLIAEKKFPQPVKLSKRAVAWKGAALKTWLDDLQ